MTGGYRRPSLNRQRLELEALEARYLPSVSALELSVPGGQPAATVPLYISGTAITLNQQGLPASLQGNIYVGMQALGPVVGHYQEMLTPLRIDGLFIGTLGQATFTFFPGSSADPPLATIHTSDVSLIAGVVPVIDALYVNSAGMITDASGAIADAQGGFSSASLVVLGPPFASNTWVEFTAL